MSDLPEAKDLERAAEWRLRCVDKDPNDTASAGAAALLQQLADELRTLQDSAVFREYGAICNWLAESDDISDFAERAHEYRLRIGIDVFPQSGEEYMKVLLGLAKQAFGAP